MDEGIGPGMDTGLGRHLDVAQAVLVKGDLQGVDDLGHGHADRFDIGAREV